MTVVSIAVIGLTAVVLAVQLKAVKGEYGTYMVLGAGLGIFFSMDCPSWKLSWKP